MEGNKTNRVPVRSKIDGAASQNGSVTSNVSAAAGTLAGAHDTAANARGKVEGIAYEGGHRLQETAQQAGHVAKEVTTKVIHSAQEVAQKVIHRAKEAQTTAEHRLHELADKANTEPASDKPEAQ